MAWLGLCTVAASLARERLLRRGPRRAAELATSAALLGLGVRLLAGAAA